MLYTPDCRGLIVCNALKKKIRGSSLNEPLVSGLRDAVSVCQVLQSDSCHLLKSWPKKLFNIRAYTSRDALVRNWTALERSESPWRLGATFKWGCNFRVREFPTRVFKFNPRRSRERERERVALFSPNVLVFFSFFFAKIARVLFITVGTRIV